MQEKTKAIEDQWRSQAITKEMKLVCDDISVAQRQLSILHNQIDKLQAQKSDLEFNANELELALETYQNTEENEEEHNQPQEGTFFTLLSQLEVSEAALTSEIKALKEHKHDLKHQQTKYKSENQILKNRLKIDQDRIETHEQQLVNERNRLLHLDTVFNDQYNEYQELVDISQKLEDESSRLTNELLSHKANLVEQLKSDIREREKELERLRKTHTELQNQYNKHERDSQKRIQEKKLEKQNIDKINSWMHDRTILIGRLRKTKTQLSNELKNLEAAKKREADIKQKFKALVGEEDPGDGTGVRARQMVQAELDQIADNAPTDLDQEIQIEQEYGTDLDIQLKKIEDSFKLFENHRKETINSLQLELDECSQDGYLVLLKSELTELQHSMSRK